MTIEIEKKVTTITTTSGDIIRLKPASSQTLLLIKSNIEKSFRDRNEPIDPPTYEIETAGGGKETHEHDETTITTEEEKAAWEKYIDASNRMRAELSIKQTKYALLTGIDIEYPDDDEWKQLQEWFGIEIPEDKNERKLHYINTEVLRTPADIKNAVSTILRITWDGVDPALIEAAEESFRNRVSSITSKAGDSAEGTQSQTRSVDSLE